MLRVDSENTFFKAETPKESATIEGTVRFLRALCK
jgi:hypothetical protein